MDGVTTVTDRGVPPEPTTEAAWNSLRADLRVATGSDVVAQQLIDWHRPAIAAEYERLSAAPGEITESELRLLDGNR